MTTVKLLTLYSLSYFFFELFCVFICNFLFGIIGLSREFNKIMIFVERQKKALQSHRVLNEVPISQPVRYMFGKSCLFGNHLQNFFFTFSSRMELQNTREPNTFSGRNIQPCRTGQLRNGVSRYF